MSDRKTISVSEDCYWDLEARKQDDDSWTDVLERLLDDAETGGGEDERNVNALTEDHIADIAAETARKTADEVENRLR